MSQTHKRRSVTFVSTSSIKVNDQVYWIRRYTAGTGPDLEQTKAIAKEAGKSLLTVAEAQEIKLNPELRSRFMSFLEEGEWGYVLDPKAEEKGNASFILNDDRMKTGLIVSHGSCTPQSTSRVVILKESASTFSAKDMETSNKKHFSVKDKEWAKEVARELGISSKNRDPPSPSKISASFELQIINQSASYQDSMKILADNNLRPITYQEALAHSAELIEKLKGKWFCLAGNGADIKENKNLYTFDLQGNLKELTGNETPDQKVRIYPGNQPLSLGVISDAFNWRFCLCADNSSYFVQAIVGIQA